MGNTLILALVVAFLGCIPFFFSEEMREDHLKFIAATFAIEFAILSIFFYVGIPTMAWPLWGMAGIGVASLWLIPALVDGVLVGKPTRLIFLPLLALCVFGVRGCSGCSAFRSAEYAGMIGPVENRTWTQDTQPADPHHIRLMSAEQAMWLANQRLGAAPGAIGSQFDIARDYLTIQSIRGELYYVVPLDFEGYTAWSAAGVSPGYIMVHAEDPTRPAEMHLHERFAYMPNAYLDHNLERHLWNHGYMWQILDGGNFEIDDDGHAWWVYSVIRPSIAYDGLRVEGVVIVNPTDGSHRFYDVASVPQWVDRVFPSFIVSDYALFYGTLRGGWWNSLWGKRDLMKPEPPSLIYGSDHVPYWVTALTSSNNNDQSMIALLYTNARTGRSRLYRVAGGTQEAILQAVNNRVSYQHRHAADPVYYNLHGTMAAIMPVLGENHTFQGVAIARTDNLQILALGDSAAEAIQEYEHLLVTSGQRISADATNTATTITTTVERFGIEVRADRTTYVLVVSDYSHILSASGTLSPELALTRAGDHVRVSFLQSDQDVVPMQSFDNLQIPTSPAPAP